MTDWQLDALGSDGELIIDGPLALNGLYCQVLAKLRVTSPLFQIDQLSSPQTAVLFLAGVKPHMATVSTLVTPGAVPELMEYRNEWRNRVGHPPAPVQSAAAIQ
jgi:hypothetical protein